MQYWLSDIQRMLDAFESRSAKQAFLEHLKTAPIVTEEQAQGHVEFLV